MNHAEKVKVATTLGKTLKALSPKQRDYMNRHAIEHFVYYTSPGKCWCTHCGKRFSVGEIHAKETCPHCGIESTTKKSGKKTAETFAYSLLMQTRGDWQILRYFLVESFVRMDGYIPKGKFAICYEPSQYQTEVLRIWINTLTKDTITERCPLKMFPNYVSKPYRETQGLKVLSRFSERSDWSKEWFYKENCPYGGSIHPYYRKRGVTMKNASDLWIDEYMKNVDKYPWGESLLKMGQIKMANLYIHQDYFVRNNERSIRIAIRHGFDFQKVLMRDYEDYLRDLKALNMDLTNPKYLCPADFLAEHQRISEKVEAKRNAERERQRREREIQEALREEQCKIAFEFRKKVYGDLVITGFGITIKPLLTADEYKAEGKAMHHCVGGYVASHPDALILSARIKGKRVETIEVDMKKWVIIQSRAVCNGTSEHHSEILDLVNGKMKTLKRMARMAS